MKKLEATVNLRLEGLKSQVAVAEKAIDGLVSELLELKKVRDKLTLQRASVGLDKKEQKELDITRAKIQKLNTSLSEQRVELTKLKSSRDKEIKNVKEAEKANREYQKSLDKTTNALKKNSNAQVQLKQTAGSANAVALEFNRIIQDAPFGIIGVGNNIQQLTSQFSVLQQRAGSSGKAISTALAAIISPVNLLSLAISAGTTLWTLYALGVFDTEESVKSLREELEELESSLTGLDKVQIDVAKSTGEERVRAIELLKVLEDLTATQEQKNRAYEILEGIYPSIIGSLDEEALKAGDVEEAYKKINAQLESRARLEALLQAQARNDVDKLLLERKLRDALIERGVAEEDLAKIREESLLDIFNRSGFFDELLGGFDPTKLFATLGNVLQKDFNIIGKELDLIGLNEDLRGIRAELGQNKVEASLFANELAKVRDALLADTGGNKVRPKSPKKEPEKLFETRSDSEGLQKDLESFILLFESFAPDVTPLQKIEEALITVSSGFAETRGVITEFGEASSDAIRSFSETLTELDPLFEEAIGSLGDYFKFANADVQRFVGVVLSQLPKVIAQIQIAQRIKELNAQRDIALTAQQAMINTALIATETAKQIPFGALALPILLAGTSALVSSFLNKNGASGGRSGAVGSASVNAGTSFSGTVGASAFAFPDFNLTSTVRGTDLKLVLDRTENTEI